MNQLKWDRTWIDWVEHRARDSTCLRRQHGALFVKHDEESDAHILISSGTNHSLDNEPCKVCIREAQNVPSGTRYEICASIHAEQDAIARAAKVGMKLDEAVLYITACPCMICARMIVAAGIKRVVIGTWEPQSLPGVVDYLRRFGLQVDYLAELECQAKQDECAVCSVASQTGNEDCQTCPNSN